MSQVSKEFIEKKNVRIAQEYTEQQRKFLEDQINATSGLVRVAKENYEQAIARLEKFNKEHPRDGAPQKE